MKDDTSIRENIGRVTRRRIRVRAELLAAAHQVFTSRGYQDATISEIITVADVAIGTFYLHFRDKEDLLFALADEAFHILRAQIHAALAHSPNEAVIPLIVRTLLQAAYEQRDMFKLICTGETHLLLHARMQQAQQGLIQHFIPAFQAAQEEGQLDSYDPVLLARLLVGMLVWAMGLWFEQDGPEPEVVAEHILFMLGQGIVPPHSMTNTERSA
ncbi:TetR family transcriptional regulator [Reticulibacter mediterranei]|uniref:TetR family transcriptional regulator n=1 Tax=Reticulibacter mediterranei TaxID=2778369 RepID=A0A8J3IQB6_9CHLR|nr:TetR/AcrR family transcriptional regulator [Reticulibacter mediterranei]GHO98253.1 TetR family transcriptional regulator [Reticulibacter mediterranei]